MHSYKTTTALFLFVWTLLFVFFVSDVKAQAPACPCSLWSDAAIPANAAVTDNQPIETGVKVRSDVNGFITAIRFYKGALNTGTHTAHLWSSSGVLLAEAAFSSETASGWQQATLSPPVAVTSNTTYVASYYSPSGYFALDQNFFASAGVNNAPLHALQSGVDGPNGVFRYGPSGFPSSGGSNNYWVDVVFQTSVAPDTTPPSVIATAPAAGATGVSLAANVSATFSEPMNSATLTPQTFKVRGPSGALISATLTYNPATRTATLDPTGGFAPQTVYTATVSGGSGGVADPAGNAMTTDFTWSFTTGAASPAPPNEGPGGPILVISTTANPFSRYLTEILRAEGLNSFTAVDISLVTPAMLASADVAVLGEMALTPAQATMLGDFVAGGGSLIAMRPDPLLSGLLGLQSTSSTLSEGYLLADTTTAPGAGITAETMQFHGTADRYTIADAATRIVATLYSDAATSTSNPALTIRNVGSNGGRAAAFAFDLARSIVYTRQGNPQWSGQERDAISPIRSDDLFFGGTERDWVDLSKVAIPQADEQQRLFANLILDANRHRKPLPRFWYFPRGIKAAIVMTGDDHANGGTTGRFDQFRTLSTPGCSVINWECIRGTSYVYNNTPGINNAAAMAFTNDGFEIGLHVTTNCADWTPSSLENFFSTQLAQFSADLPGIPAPATNRTHCIAWSDYTTEAHVELAHGIRFDTNYYYYPGSWIQDRPGFMTGSGMPMRFADADGTTIDVYQAATQMTDESGQSYPFTVDTLLNRALGPLGYYGAFVANMHTDQATTSQDDAVVASAKTSGVPVVTSRQMLEWVDGRNNSSFQSLTWNAGSLSFSVAAGSGANGLTGLVPAAAATGPITSITRNGASVAYTLQTIKGMDYAVFAAAAGSYTVSYAVDVTPPIITGVSATPGAGGTATIRWTTDELSDSRVSYGVSPGSLTNSVSSAVPAQSHSLTLTGLSPYTTYYFRVSSADAAGNTSTSPAPPSGPAQFAMGALIINLTDTTVADFMAGTPDATAAVAETGNGEVILAPAAGSEFYGTAVPGDWSVVPWSAGGTASVAGGRLVVDGARAGTIADFAPGRSVEFTATFSGAPFQHAGFGVTYDAAPWTMFSTSGGGALFARTNNGSASSDTALGAGWLGSAHRFRIDWAAASVTYSIDGAVVATHPIAIAANMRPLVSDFNVGSGTLTVDWVRMTPYAASGSFTSRGFDAGEIVNWGALSWTAGTPAGTPAGTSVAFSVRAGNTPVPDGSWTSFTTVAMSGGAIAARSRYAQYRATLATSNAAATPSVDEVTIGFARNTPPAAGNDTYAMDQGTTLSVPAPGVLANDTDPDHDVLAAALVSGPAHGAVILNADGSFSYTPQAAFSGSDSFTYTAGDGIAVSAPATVTITVRAVVPPPAPADWFMAAWSAGGSATTTDNGVIVDGARTGTNATYAPGRSLEFVATFSGDAWQHIGFGVDYTSGPWIIFSTFQGGGLYARTATGSGDSIDTPLPGNWLGSAHRYRIDWNASNTVFSIDGTVVATHALAVTASLRPLISDVNAGGGSIVVASITIGSISGLPANWFSAAWAEGGSARASNGTLTIDGARAGSNVLYGPGQSVEFVATFSGDAWQHIGFGLDYDAAPWIIFSTFQGGQLYARTKTPDGQSVDTPVPGNWLGSEHRYRIDWNANSAVFSIDGTVVATTTVSIQDHLRALVSDFNVAGGTIAVTSVH